MIGWAGRTWSAACPYDNNPFLMQISTLIIGTLPHPRVVVHMLTYGEAPTFFTAGIYIILGRLIQIMGQRYSPITPRLYLYIFCTCDFISLVVQAIGGGLASVAAGEVNGNTKPGTDIMVAGIIFQMAAISAFLYLFAVFMWRTRKTTVPRPLKFVVAATTASVAAIYVRSIYRTIELLQGWSGFLITHQAYFIAFDGAMMVFAVAVFNVINPGWFLNDRRVFADRSSTADQELTAKSFEHESQGNGESSSAAVV